MTDSSSSSLAGRYVAIVCDLDGVVYRGPTAVPHAVEALTGVDRPVLYATNNASRSPDDVAAHLTGLGLACGADSVATSAQAGAWLLGDRLGAGSLVLAVGGPGVAQALTDAGLGVRGPAEAGSATRRDESVSGVLQGYGPDVSAAHLAEVAYAVHGGALWVASNTDRTLPTDRGVAPGNGSLVGAVEAAVGRAPDLVAGKPQPPLYHLCAQRLGVDPSDMLAIGDRLDTDIEGAVAAGMDSLLVLTGVDDLEAVLAAPASRRPTFVAPDLRSLVGDVAEGATDDPLRDLSAAVGAVHAAHDDGADDARVRALADLARNVLARAAGR